MSASTLQVIDPASGIVLLPTQTYAPGAPIQGNGFNFTISGAPAAGDIFDVASAATASGNAGAVERLLATRDAPVGTATLENRWDSTSNVISTQLADVKLAATAASQTLDITNSARDGASGVNLDAEATDLVRFQQAYQASAKIIQAARDIFNQLLQIG